MCVETEHFTISFCLQCCTRNHTSFHCTLLSVTVCLAAVYLGHLEQPAWIPFGGWNHGVRAPCHVTIPQNAKIVGITLLPRPHVTVLLSILRTCYIVCSMTHTCSSAGHMCIGGLPGMLYASAVHRHIYKSSCIIPVSSNSDKIHSCHSV